MKKLSIIILCMTLCTVLISCQKTPDESLVAQKNPERLESAAAETAEKESSLKEQKKAVTENYAFHYENEDKTLIINGDVPVTMPENDTIPAFHASSGTICQELATQIYDYLFPDGKTYIFSGTDRTKSAIEKEILKQKQWMAELEESKDLAEEFKQDSITDIRSVIADLEEEYKNAPEKSTLVKTPVDSTLVKNTSPDLSSCDYELHCETEQGETLDIFSYPVNDIPSSDIYYKRCSQTKDCDIRYFFDCSTPVSEEQARNVSRKSMELSYDDARETAEEFLKATGIQTSLLQTYLLKGIISETSNSSNKYLSDSTIVNYEKNYSAFHFVYTRKLDGTELALYRINHYLTDSDSEESYSIKWNAETIDILVSPSGIEEISWKNPLTIGEKVSNDVNLLPFEKASAIFEKMVPTVYLGRLELENSGDFTYSYKLNITSVKLCLMQIRNNGSEKSGLLVPAWVFYGEWWKIPDQNPEEPKYFDYPPYILMAVNAVDGTLIDPWEGY